MSGSWTGILSRALGVPAILLFTGCIGDAVGVGDLSVVVEGRPADSAWVAAPGADTLVRVRVNNLAGEPVAGVRVSWSATGSGSQVTQSGATDRWGYAAARWTIGTKATERQELRVTARTSRADAEAVLRGRLAPAVVASFSLGSHTHLEARVGDTVPIVVMAIDPYGNAFRPADLTVTLADSTMGVVRDSLLIAGPRRGRTALRLASGGVAGTIPLDVVQRVAAIEPAMDSVVFTSLRAEQIVDAVIRDDRGLVVADTMPGYALVDSAVAVLVDDRVRATGNGATTLQVSLGGVSVAIPVRVRQRIASLRLVRDTVHFDALSDTTTLRPIAFDSLGSEVRDPELVIEIGDGSVAAAAGGLTVQAVQPGTTVVTARDPVTGLAATVEVVVRQRVAAISLPATPIVFDALADSFIVIAAVTDRLGSSVSDARLEYLVSDSTVVVFDAGGNRLRSVRPGQASVMVRDPESGLAASRAVRVEQVAAALRVNVTFPGAVVTLPAGAPLPLECLAEDRNGFPVAQPAALVRTVRGTVTGGCADARIVQSGYDTLVFAVGAAEARVPVIVATEPDSVGIVVAAQPLTDDLRARFEGEDVTNPLIVALRPLVAEIMHVYGDPVARLDRARALRDWVARTAVHPDPSLHPDGSTANLSVLPPGKAWADVNALQWKEEEDHLYWSGMYYDGYVMLDELLGTLDPSTGVRADDGMMERIASGRYRIRDVATYRYVLCSYQAIILSALWAADGLHGFRVAIVGHDPAAVFIPELGDWIYQDPTFNEEYLLDGGGQPLSPLQLVARSTAGEVSRLRAVKRQGPSFDPEPYIAGRRYLDAGHPEGIVIAGGQLNARVVGRKAAWGTRYVQADVPALSTVPAPWSDPSSYLPVAPDVAFPLLAPVVLETTLSDSVPVVRLSSTYPGHQRFERRLGGRDWQPVDATDVLPVGACRVEYRSVDAAGGTSASAMLDVWVPRAEDFVRLAPAGSIRAQAGWCWAPPIP